MVHYLLFCKGLNRTYAPLVLTLFVGCLCVLYFMFHVEIWIHPYIHMTQISVGNHALCTTHDSGRLGRINSTEPSNHSVSEYLRNRTISCHFPDFDPFDPKIMQFVKKHPVIDCSKHTPNLVYIDNDYLMVNHSKIQNRKINFKHCVYSSRIRDPTDKYDLRTKTIRISDSFQYSVRLNDSDHYVFVECFGEKNITVSRSFIYRIRELPWVEETLKADLEKHRALRSPKETLSVMMVGVDGTSKQNFQRSMPRTREFILKELLPVELRRFNKVGLNTYPNLLGLLAGRLESELDGFKWDQSLDVINDLFLWSDYRRAGYRTGMFLDMKTITAFHFQKRGWARAPVDYYIREPVMDSEDDKLMRSERQNCIGDETEIKYLTDHWIKLASLFRNSSTQPYFVFSFAARLTHDDQNMASAGDDHYYSFFKTLKDKNLLNNTVLVFFSDHGERFGAIRSTYYGMMEGRTPFFYLVFPPWFKSKYPDLMTTMSVNQDRLTSHFDIYQTLKDLINFQANTGKGNSTSRGISLFREIPKERTCHHINVSLEYCACAQLSPSNVDAETTQRLANAMVDKIVSNTARFRNECSVLVLKSVQAVLQMETPKGQDKTFTLIITTVPGEAIYEGVVKLDSKNSAEVVGSVIRLNMYKGQAECVENPTLRQFCYCLNNKQKGKS